MPVPPDDASKPGLLGDTAQRDYSRKLGLFMRFAEPELRAAIATLGLAPGMHVLDAGCGSGESLAWLAEAVGTGGRVVGVDLSYAHLAAARRQAPPQVQLLAGDLMTLVMPAASFDAIWSANTLHHFTDPLAALQRLSGWLQAGGRLVVGQTGFLPEMLFAWDMRLERAVVDAVRAHYRDKYGLDERRLAAVRANVGLLRQAGLADVQARTFTIERISPLDAAARDYVLEAQFRSTFGERLRPWLSAEDFAALQKLCDPDDPGFALDRPDFHYLQTFTVVSGRKS
ncbi:SAM-dependent methyltransferase [Pelomonas saccharophila]|uniref:SAM-dependent methyltransferase n=1 Tax=Roseateles saccharophilus TaxID=304 RepID=A0ABU1YFY1_ROSSA|nr:class I SAM-dependent methyltransferase [Roseateles saccharophilus]MDR7267760.1 SAM-dependent methyltransferase [Roseateles saccharophilus]